MDRPQGDGGGGTAREAGRGERREEEQRHEKIFSAQARAPSEATDASPNEVETLRTKLHVAEAARGEAELSAVRCRIVLKHPAVCVILSVGSAGSLLLYLETHAGESASQAAQGREQDERAEERRSETTLYA